MLAGSALRSCDESHMQDRCEVVRALSRNSSGPHFRTHLLHRDLIHAHDITFSRTICLACAKARSKRSCSRRLHVSLSNHHHDRHQSERRRPVKRERRTQTQVATLPRNLASLHLLYGPNHPRPLHQLHLLQENGAMFSNTSTRATKVTMRALLAQQIQQVSLVWSNMRYNKCICLTKLMLTSHSAMLKSQLTSQQGNRCFHHKNFCVTQQNGM